ncbi:MAG: flagellar biosynthetic protein FliR [Planctomycetota bacterium JB042]
MDAWLQELPILPIARVLAVASAFPLLAGPGAPKTVRLATALVLALVLVPAPFGVATVGHPSPVATLALLPLELGIGLAIGFGFSLVFHLLGVAGDFLGQEMGLNASSQIDPVTGRSVPLLARLFEALGLILFVELGGLELLLRTVRESFVLVPPGALVAPERLAATLAADSIGVVTRGIAVALPGAILLLVLTSFTTIAARVLPKLHIFDFAFAIRMFVAILLVSLLLPRLVPAVGDAAIHLHERLTGALTTR